MDSVRVRLASIVEWIVAAAFLAATIGVATLILRNVQMPAVRASGAQTRQGPISAMPASVPSGAVSVPVLPFQNGKDIRVGEEASAVASALGRAAETGREAIDRGALGDRVARFYDYGGFRFIVVYEPFEHAGAMRVGAIYLP